ncbi:glycosyltransferase [Flavobacterium sp. SM2513]|uniref:glycosyltransferase n=1 Tax=Flavobacterium sp. SM2513 TaxID=3424766 RepID=UPI003D7FB44F
MDKIKKVLIADWLDAYGGAERVIKSINDVFNFNKTYTLICIMKKDNLFKLFSSNNPEIKQTALKNFGRKFRYLFFLFHYFINKFKIPADTQLIFSSSHSVAKGIKKSSEKQLHISYFQARNFNYIWEDKFLFFGKFSTLFYPLIFVLRKIDVTHSKRPDYIIANSNFVKDWVKKRYNRDATVIYPPVDLSKFDLNSEKEEFYVAVGRIVTVKRFDLLVEAFNENKKKLIIIGDGQNLKTLKKHAKSNITFTGFLETAQLKKYISNAKGFIQPGIEGFGIAILEAQACGTPIIAYGRGGALETVEDLKTGVFFLNQTKESIQEALIMFENIKFDSLYIRNQALKFSEERFKQELSAFVKSKFEEHNILIN